jgi:hypothetical protein
VVVVAAVVVFDALFEPHPAAIVSSASNPIAAVMPRYLVKASLLSVPVRLETFFRLARALDLAAVPGLDLLADGEEAGPFLSEAGDGSGQPPLSFLRQAQEANARVPGRELA